MINLTEQNLAVALECIKVVLDQDKGLVALVGSRLERHCGALPPVLAGDTEGALRDAWDALVVALKECPSREELVENRQVLERDLYYVVEMARLQHEHQTRANTIDDMPFCEMRRQGEEFAYRDLSGLAHDKYRETIRRLLDQYTPEIKEVASARQP